MTTDTNDGNRTDGRIAAVVLDWAGTVLDFGCMAPVAAFQAAFEDAGVPIDEAEAREPMGAAKRDHIERILEMRDVRARWRENHGGEPEDADVDALYAAFLRADADEVARYSELIPGARETIDGVRGRGVAIGSTTGYPREVMERLEPLAAAQGYAPDHVCTATDVARGRPFPDMVLHTLDALGGPDANLCVVVDDSPSGIASGRAAGAWAVGIAASGNEVGLPRADWDALDAGEREKRLKLARERLGSSGAHYVVETIADLPGVIDAIERRLGAGEVA